MLTAGEHNPYMRYVGRMERVPGHKHLKGSTFELVFIIVIGQTTGTPPEGAPKVMRPRPKKPALAAR